MSISDEHARQAETIIKPILENITSSYPSKETERLVYNVKNYTQGAPQKSIHSQQSPDFLYEGLSSKPVYRCEDFSFSSIFQSNTTTYKTELNNYLSQQPQQKGDIHLVNQFATNTDELSFNREYFSKTLSDLKAVSNLGEIALFASLDPLDCTDLYCAPSNLRLLYIFPVVCSRKNQLTVACQKFQLNEGRPLIIDPSFYHQAINDDNNIVRYCLLFDFWHPDLTQAEIEFFKEVGPKLVN